MNLTAQVAKLPWSAQKEIVGAFRNHGDHQQQIGHGQIDDQHVGRCPQRRIVTENPQSDDVTTNGDRPFTISNMFLKR